MVKIFFYDNFKNICEYGEARIYNMAFGPISNMIILKIQYVYACVYESSHIEVRAQPCGLN